MYLIKYNKTILLIPQILYFMNLNGFVNTPTFLKLLIREKAVTLIIFIQCLCKNMQMYVC